MASQGPRKLEEKLVCSICLEIFGTAVTVPCGHNFCMKCINHHWDKEEKAAGPGEKEYTCPDCRQRFEQRLEPRKNVALCSVVELVRAGEVQASGAERKALADGGRCSRHGRPLELYCQEEKLCICCVCTVKECRDHHRVLVEEERRRKEALLEESLAKTRDETLKTQEEMDRLEEQTGTIKDSSERLKSGILQKFAHLVKGLEECQRRAVGKIEQEQATALGQVAENWSQLQDHLAMLTQHRQKAQELLTCGDNVKFLEEFLLLPSVASLGVLPAVEFNAARTVETTAAILTEVSRLLLEDLPNSLNPREAGAEAKEPTEPKAIAVVKMGPALPECELRVELLKGDGRWMQIFFIGLKTLLAERAAGASNCVPKSPWECVIFQPQGSILLTLMPGPTSPIVSSAPLGRLTVVFAASMQVKACVFAGCSHDTCCCYLY
ncbi:E3 ubiquitin-protein ligase TRIM65 isoform X2 [Carettochelys insculpta]|uniref:E3 ubiquitin-protein ligase TRIM65 isoform X2 n=1 Tax=Carettochelys insculpta TaxID=44489 RepID=UPI003EB8675A